MKYRVLVAFPEGKINSSGGAAGYLSNLKAGFEQLESPSVSLDYLPGGGMDIWLHIRSLNSIE